MLADEEGTRRPAFTLQANAPAFLFMGRTGSGCNSLLDLIVFGRRAGIAMREEVLQLRPLRQ